MKNKDNDKVVVGFSSATINNILPDNRPFKEDIELKVAYFCQGEMKCCWIVLDLMDLNKKFVDEIKKGVNQTSDIVLDHIHILTTHNHGVGDPEDLSAGGIARIASSAVANAIGLARAGYMRYGELMLNEQLNYLRRLYVKELEGSTTFFWGPSPDNDFDAVPFLQNNINNLTHGKVSYSGSCGIVTQEQTVRLPPGDSRLQVLFFEEEDGTPIGSICRFAAHAICCNSPDYYSSDYPYYARKALKNELGGTVVFMNGPCAEIAPGVSDKKSGMEHKIGLRIGQLAVKLIKKAKREEVVFLEDCSQEVRLPLREELLNINLRNEIKTVKPRLCQSDSMPLPELKRLAEYDYLLSTIDFLKRKTTGGKEQIVTLGKVTLNDITMMALPGEVFSSTAENAIKRENEEKFITVTEHGGTAMYIVPEAEYHLGGYETTCCMVSANAEQILVKAIQDFKKL